VVVEDVEEVEHVEHVEDIMVQDLVDETSLGTTGITGMYSIHGGLTTHAPTMLLKNVEETITMSLVTNLSITGV
jgi:hypothetical protein